MLFIDNRVGSKEFVNAFKPFGIPTELTTLDYGDFCFVGNGPDGTKRTVAIERKEIHDMLVSLRDGRLSGHQLIGLCNTYDRVVLLVEGQYRPNPADGIMEELVNGAYWRPVRGKFMYRELSAFLMTMREIAGLEIERSRDKSETVYLIATWYKWYEKLWEDHSGHRILHKSSLEKGIRAIKFSKPSLLRKVLSQIEDIADTKSMHVEQHFSSVYDMVNADESEWMKIKWKTGNGRNQSIGPKTAASIVAALRNLKIEEAESHKHAIQGK